jgi:ketosteroid isomerase-like protein
MKEINAAFNSRDVDRIMAFFADDATFLMARGPEAEGRRVRGKDAIRKVLADYEVHGNKILNKDTYWKLVEQRARL